MPKGKPRDGSKNPGGRPTKFTKKIQLEIQEFMQEGFTDLEVCEKVGIDKQTLNNWKKSKPKFFASIKDWKLEADKEIERSLRDRAKGYVCEEDKIFCNQHGEVTVVPTKKHYPPDPTSMIFWLKNRHPERWRDKHEVSGDMNIQIVRKEYKKQ